uniref:CDP-diacylglycerol--glycerol-3-phosphate 3-phosphatidyltransferase n=1 Tax=Ursus maritimus TaxID=29073 RepID=A0A452UD27_URSMA
MSCPWRAASGQVDCLESTLEKSLQAKFPSDLKVSILLDFTRGSRGRKNSRTMLLPLLQRFPEQVRVSLFHTPNLRGLLRLLIPERFNETIGLQHMKVYLFDNNVILSGANLSDSYFTNRQDRYVFLQDCAEIADFFTELVDAVGDVSLQLQGDDTVRAVEGMVHPYKGDRAAYCRAANKRVMDVINSARARQQVLHAQTFHGDSLLTQEDAAAAGDRRPAPDTWIYPLIQMKPFEIQIDEIVTETLLTEAERGTKVYLTTGYFNLTQAYMDLVLGTRAEYQILLASPEVGSPGPGGPDRHSDGEPGLAAAASPGMALMKMTGMAGVSSFSLASAMTPVWVSQRAPAGQHGEDGAEQFL